MDKQRFRGSPLTALRYTYPEFFDYSHPDHLHDWDFQQNSKWQKEGSDEMAHLAIRHMIEAHDLGRSARPADLKKMTARKFRRLGLARVLRSDKFHASPLAALRHAYPEFFEYSRPDHLHVWNTRKREQWQDRRSDGLAREATRHMINTHYLGRPAQVEDLSRVTMWVLRHLKLDGMIQTKFRSSPIAALRHAYPEFAEAIGRRIRGTADFVEVLEAEDHKRAPKLLRDLMSHFGDDLVDVADILAVVYTGRLEAKTAMEILQNPTMRPWIVPFDGGGHGPGKPPIGDDFPFYLLEKDRNGVIAGIIRRRLTEWRRRVLGARPNKEARERFLRELRVMQERLVNGGNKVTLAAE